ncbi:MAG: type II toxin-antitoxin system YoeB family toxin [Candidatus Giovannonibacteria bacterium]|nr:MAG: type II toxin-antitoxin system YoeB family toxin [Candidatus Giovannonibacteria bacterium]
MRLRPLGKHVLRRIKKWRLEKKWQKAVALFLINPQHPSLNSELMEPKHRGIYSFRIDKKYRALYFIEDEELEIFQITKHYRK